MGRVKKMLLEKNEIEVIKDGKKIKARWCSTCLTLHPLQKCVCGELHAKKS